MEGNGSLNLKVTDVNGNPMPCRVHIKQKDGTCWVPPDVRDPIYTDAFAPDLLLPTHYIRYLHLCQGLCQNLKSVHLNHGSAEMAVPADELQIHIARGYEYAPVTDSFQVKAGETVTKEYRLSRSANLAGEGWYGGDMHTHFSRWQPNDNYVWGRFLAAEDLYAVNNMVFKHAGNVEAPQYDYGEAAQHVVQDHHHGHSVVASGEEFRDDDTYGHMISAGIEELIEPISTGHKLGRRESYPLFASVCDWTHEQGGVAGWAHGGTMIKLFESLPIEAALGKLDFVENIQFNLFYGCVFWYRLLNCGIRLSCTGGSDFPFWAEMLAPWYPNLGLDRTYAHVEADYSYRGWIEGVRRGNTFASNGPLLTFTVNGRPAGAEVLVEGSENAVRVKASAVCNYGLDCLEVVRNGAVVMRVEGNGGQTEIACDEKIPLGESAWFAVRARGKVEPERYGGVMQWNLHAHSSPAYVLKGGRPICLESDLTGMADYVRMVMEIYRRGGKFDKEEHREEMLTNCTDAIAFYERAIG